jgi:hypothetical protein
LADNPCVIPGSEFVHQEHRPENVECHIPEVILLHVKVDDKALFLGATDDREQARNNGLSCRITGHRVKAGIQTRKLDGHIDHRDVAPARGVRLRLTGPRLTGNRQVFEQLEVLLLVG